LIAGIVGTIADGSIAEQYRGRRNTMKNARS
jgi:hypothetical protein